MGGIPFAAHHTIIFFENFFLMRYFIELSHQFIMEILKASLSVDVLILLFERHFLEIRSQKIVFQLFASENVEIVSDLHNFD